MLGKQPAFLFYTGDWKKDPDLSKCSAATRGIWMDLLCAMHENGRTGIITGTVLELAQMCRCSEPEMTFALIELKRNKTAHVQKIPRMSNGYQVTNRRMNREHKDREYWRLQKRKKRGVKRDAKMSSEIPSSSSCSSSFSSSEEDMGVTKKGKERESSSASKRGTLSDDFSEEYLDELQDRKAYRHLDVRFVFEKWKGHVRDTGGTGNRAHFLGWLNREIPNRKENGPDDDRGSSEQAARVAASLSRDN